MMRTTFSTRMGVTVGFVATLVVAVLTRPALAQDCEWPVWTQVASDPELARFEHAMAYDAARDVVVAFGGRPGFNQVLGDTLVWDGAEWSRLGVAGPEARAGHAMAYDAARERVVLTGGVDSAGLALRDTWAWDGAAWMMISASAPVSEGHVMAYDPAGERLLLASAAGELWSLDGKGWRLLSMDGPTRRDAAVAFDPIRGVLVVAGGLGGTSYTAEWSEASGWWHAGVGGFPFNALVEHVAFWSPAKRGVMVFGGSDLQGFFGGNGVPITLRSGTFVWDGGRWATWGVSGIFGRESWHRYKHAVAALPNGGAIVFGGVRVDGALGDTLSLGFGAATPEPLFLWALYAGGVRAWNSNVAMQAITSDGAGWWFKVGDRGSNYEWRRNGELLVDGQGPGAFVFGQGTGVLELSRIRPEDEGLYTVVVTSCSATLDLGGVPLTLACPPDLTTTAVSSQSGYGRPDGVLNADDFFYFLAQFAETTPVADITTSGATVPGQPGYLMPDGVLNGDDFFAYLGLYAAGC